MKMLNKKFVRTLSCAAVAVCAAAMLSVGAFAAEVDSTCVEGYLPPQEQMVQGDIALHSADVAIGEKDPTYGGYGAPAGPAIQGNIMLIGADGAESDTHPFVDGPSNFTEKPEGVPGAAASGVASGIAIPSICSLCGKSAMSVALPVLRSTE